MHRAALSSPDSALRKSEETDSPPTTASSRVQSAPGDALSETLRAKVLGERVGLADKALFTKPDIAGNNGSKTVEMNNDSKPPANTAGAAAATAIANAIDSTSRAKSEGESSLPISPGRGASSADEDNVASPSAAVPGDSLLVGYHNLNRLDDVDLPSYVREHNTTLSFPEKLMLMLIHIERIQAKTGEKAESAPIGWVADGQAFVIRDKAKLCSKWLPLFFRQAKFSSFTRKLYRWGFRQVNLAADAPQLTREMFFGNENFQRDNTSLLTKMRSITAAGRRREQAAQDARRVGGPDSHLPGLTPELSQLLQSGGGALPTIPNLHAAFSGSSSLPNLTPQSFQAVAEAVSASSGLFGLGALGATPGTSGQPALTLAQAQQLMLHHQLSLPPQDAAATRHLLSLSQQSPPTGAGGGTAGPSTSSSTLAPTAHLAARLGPPQMGALPFHLASLQQQQQQHLQQQQQHLQQAQQQFQPQVQNQQALSSTEEQQRMRAVFEMLLRNNDPSQQQSQQKQP